MRRIAIVLSLLFVGFFSSYAQTDDCESGFCPEVLTAHHSLGVVGASVAPEDITITYDVVETTLSGTTACWIAQNLGASDPPSSSTSTTVSERGWFWQFNRKYGYTYNGDRTSWVSSIDESSNWLAENDPCTILLGEHWRLPTLSEWNAADSWTAATDAYASDLKLHMTGYLEATGSISNSGSRGYFWSSTESTSALGNYLIVYSSTQVTTRDKAIGCSARCLRTYSW